MANKHSRVHRVLVIDDNPEIHNDFRKILCAERARSSKLETLEAALFNEPDTLGNQSQFEVDSAFQGKEGLARVCHALQEGRPYEMAFVDVRMPPGLDGIEVTPMLWSVDPCLPIIICTAYADYSWEEMFAKIGASDRMFILKKPFDRMEVLQLAHALVAKGRLRRDNRLRLSRLESTVQDQIRNLQTMSGKLQAEIRQLKDPGQDTA